MVRISRILTIVFALLLCAGGEALAQANASTPSSSVTVKNSDIEKNEHSSGLSHKFLNCVFFGVGAGTLVGVAAITNFKTNFSKNADFGNVARGASYGLYGGILLGIYLTSTSSHSKKDLPEDYPQDQEAGEAAGQMKTHIDVASKSVEKPFYVPDVISPLLDVGHVNGIYAQWELLRF